MNKTPPSKPTMERPNPGGKGTGVNRPMEPANSRTPQVVMKNTYGLIGPKQKS